MDLVEAYDDETNKAQIEYISNEFEVLSLMVNYFNKMHITKDHEDELPQRLSFKDNDNNTIEDIKDNLEEQLCIKKLIETDYGFFTLIKNNEYDKFENYLKKRESFIKLFKPNLINIEPNYQKIDDKYSVASILLVYKDYEILFDLESAGTKKLFHLVSSLLQLDAGDIVVIDELDTSIHDLILEKLIDYVSYFSYGQLIFTSHNLSSMPVLETAKHSIDFITRENKIVKWVKGGNRKAKTFYQLGNIPGIPFNFSMTDILHCLMNGKD